MSKGKKAKKDSVIFHPASEDNPPVTLHTQKSSGLGKLLGKVKDKVKALKRKRQDEESESEKESAPAEPDKKSKTTVTQTKADQERNLRRQELMRINAGEIESCIKKGESLALEVLVYRLLRGELAELQGKEYYKFFADLGRGSYEDKSAKGKKAREYEAQKAFAAAVRDGNILVINRFLSKEKDKICPNGDEAAIDVDFTDSTGKTPLIIAAENNQYTAAIILAEAGANINKADRTGKTPLIISIEKGFGQIATLLLGKDGIDVTAADNSGMTALLFAAKTEQNQIAYDILNILSQSPDAARHINATSDKGESALGIATFSFNTKLVQKLLEARAEVSMKNNSNILLDFLKSKELCDKITDNDAMEDFDIDNEYLVIIASFLKIPGALNKVNDKGENVYLSAVRTGDEELIKLVYQKKMRLATLEPEVPGGLKEAMKDFDACVLAIGNILSKKIHKLDDESKKSDSSMVGAVKNKFKSMAGKTTEQRVKKLLDETIKQYGAPHEALIFNPETILLAAFDKAGIPTSEKSKSLREKILTENGVDVRSFAPKEEKKGDVKSGKPSARVAPGAALSIAEESVRSSDSR